MPSRAPDDDTRFATRRTASSVLTRILVGLVGFLGVAAIATAGQAAQAVATPLYPDLKTLPPRDIRFDVTDTSYNLDGSSVHKVVRFSNTVFNAGEGKVELRATIDPVTKDGTAYQRIFSSDGSYRDVNAGRLYYHAAHDHWHYDGWGHYELWTKADYDAWIASGRNPAQAHYLAGSKSSACVEDEEFVVDAPGTTYPGSYDAGGCYPDANGFIHEGLSPGWGDTYDYYRPAQWFDLGSRDATLTDGTYVIRSVADPYNQIWESDNKSDPSREGDAGNEATTGFVVQGGQIVDSDPPTGTVFVNGVDPTTPTPTVRVYGVGRDDVSGVNQLRLSNDGSHWATFPYTTTGSFPTIVSWDLADPAYGGTSTAGTKTVYCQFHDASPGGGKWGPTTTDTIQLTAPAPPSSYSTAVNADSPAGYWRLDELAGTTARDTAAGGANPGSYRNSPTLGAPSLLGAETSDAAVSFDGASEYMSVPSSASLSPTAALSLEAWIRPAAIPTTGNFASVLTKAESYSLQFNGPRLEFTVIQNGTRRRLQAAVGAIQVGQLYHVVGTYDGATQRLYVNGTQAVSAPLTGAASATSSPVTVASWNGSEFFQGTIDEPAVYRTALSAARVSAHYTTGAGASGTAPAAPTALVAAAQSSSIVNLTWTDNATNETGYVVERDTSAAFTAPVSRTVGANTSSYSDTGLASSTTYYYRVKGVNGSGSSAYSNTANATTTGAAGPAAPTSLTASAASSSAINLTWVDNAIDESGFVVERDTTSAFTAPVTQSLPVNTTSFQATSLLAGTTYYFRVKAVNAAGSSAYSNTAGATTQPSATVPAAPTALTATAQSSSAIDVAWTDNATNETGYMLERDTNNSFPAPVTTTLAANSTSFQSTGLAASTTYYFRVKAVNAAGSSAASNVSSATTSAPPPTGYAAVVTADNPAGYWRLAETSGTTAADEKGANNGTYTNAPGLGAGSLLAAEPTNKAVSFDGVNDYVSVGNSSSLSPTAAVTLEAWIKPSSIPASGSFASIISKPESYSLQFNGPQLEFTIIQNGVRRRLQATPGAIAAGQTYFVAGTYDGTTQRLYINFAQVASQPLSGAISLTSNPLSIGSWGAGEYFQGTIDEPAVFPTALSGARLTAHYNAGSGASSGTPAAPSGLVATSASSTSISLSWADNSTNETGFVLERAATSAFSTPVAISLPSNTQAYSDTGLAPSTTYYYRVKATNSAGSSAPSNTASATTAAPTGPVPPTGLTAAAGSSSTIDLSWTDNAVDETGYVVERDTTGTFPSPISTNLPAGSAAYHDTGLTASTTYYYRVKAVNGPTASGYSNTASATTTSGTGAPPAAPTSLTATAAGPSTINLSWTDNASTETGYVVEVDTAVTFPSPATATLGANATAYQSTGRAPSTTYYYRVKATNGFGSSGYSNVAAATSAPSAYVTSVLADGPAGYWRLGETSGTTAVDQRSANNGAYGGGPTLGAASLLPQDTSNKAVSFDGSNDTVSIPNAAALGPTAAVTVEAWIKPSAIPALGAFSSVVTKAESYSLQFNGPRFEFTIIQNGVRRRLQAAAGAIQAGAAYYVVGTYDGSTQRLYVNGSELVNAALSGAISPAATPLTIGSWGNAEYFTGTIDEAAVYPTALSAARVSGHYAAGR